MYNKRYIITEIIHYKIIFTLSCVIYLGESIYYSTGYEQ